MMLDASPPSFCASATKRFDPLRAMVPRFVPSSASVMPMPLSSIVSVPASASVVIEIRSSSSPSAVATLLTRRRRHFSRASDAFDNSSRRNTSRSL